MNDVYVSVDVETDGPIPGRNSMLSIGAVAYVDLVPVSEFSINLFPLHTADQDPDTMKWWETQPEAWKALQEDRHFASTAMRRFVQWLGALPGKPTFVAYPAGFDFTFVHYYMHRFTGEDLFGFSALDLKTFAWTLLGGNYSDAKISNMPKEWLEGCDHEHTHVALDDARQQGRMLCNMMAYAQDRGLWKKEG